MAGMIGILVNTIKITKSIFKGRLKPALFYFKSKKESMMNQQFVCDFVVNVQDAGKFDIEKLREYLSEAVGIYLNDEEAGRFEAGGEDATVSLSINLDTLSQRVDLKN